MTKVTPGLERGMKQGRPVYGKKHERKYHGRIGRKSIRTWLRSKRGKEMEIE